MRMLWLMIREALFIAYMVTWIVVLVRLIPDKPQRRFLWEDNPPSK